ncbi:FkbM family methyltransferase [Oryzicola mucosus]|uniref:FkbM family methyltransferase n=1 Tax=Oryzicola mucosus TaxID=2767425 RepID=A0A8J6PT83_9HYPH|nr:FkbM family methyltransferase [Oryzicola mucosus]MBD0413468.1 FkbM family methyltransferase [Oryzicola mucosus]
MLGTLGYIWNHPLNKNGRWSALLRFVRWQISTRLMAVPHYIPFVNDTVLVMERGMTGATGNWYCGLHEEADMGFALRLLRREDIFVDVGANIGSYSILASGAVGAKTFAFEPAEETYPKLIRNVLANDLQHRISSFNFGLGAKEEQLKFTKGRDTTNHIVTAGVGVSIVDVVVRRLDDVLEGSEPRLIKIDVEGWEAEVLEGMPNTLKSSTLVAIIVETNQSGMRYGKSGESRVFSILKASGFAPYSYDPISSELTAGASDHNTIFLRDIGFVKQRLKTAERYKLVNGFF